MIFIAYIRISDVETVVDPLRQLSADLRPSHFTITEGRVNKGDVISDDARLRAFMQANPLGFFLVAPKCVYNIEFRANDYSLISIDADTILGESQIAPLFDLTGSMGAEFGFAATPEEYHHRNRVCRDMGNAHIESWVGRDLKKYVPGLFWRTLLSDRLITQRGLDLSLLPRCVFTERLECDALLLKVDGGISEWQMHAAEIDHFCVSTPGFFSKSKLPDSVAAATDLIRLTQVLADWR